MSKHTGSGWRLIDVLSCVTVFAGNPERVIARFDSPSQEDRANARLIAAAPELLESLVALKTLLAPLAYDSTQKDWLNRARATIAKATGEAQ